MSNNGKAVDMKTLWRIMLETENRGQHAFGWAWVDKNGKLRSFKAQGCGSFEGREKFWRMEGATAVIGHCRFATAGSPSDNRNNHPHKIDGGWLVHNGVVPSHLSVIAKHKLVLESECDSEVIAKLAEKTGGGRMNMIVEAFSKLPGEHAVAVLWAGPELVLARRGRPIHLSVAKGGLWFASEPQSLPGKKVRSMKNLSAVRYGDDAKVAAA